MPKGNREMHPESSARVNRRAFLEVAAGAVTGAAIAGGIPEIAAARKSESNHGGGPLYMQTNEIQNAIIYYRRDAKGALTEVERVLTAAPVPGLSSRSAASKARRTPLKAPVASSSRRTGSFCSRPTAATIRSRASVLARTGGSRGSTSNRRETPSRERAAPPNAWPMPPRRACFTCCTHSAPTICG
jgi:hypothetical protein